MSTYREDIAELISAQIEKALEKEYDRGWDESVSYTHLTLPTPPYV